MHHILGGFLIGTFFTASMYSARVRPVLRGAVKAGLRTRDKLGQLGAKVKAESQSIVDEARAQLDQEKQHQHVE